MDDEKGIESSERNYYVILAQDYKGCPDGKFHVNCGNLLIFQSNLIFQLMGIFMFHHEQPKIRAYDVLLSKKTSWLLGHGGGYWIQQATERFQRHNWTLVCKVVLQSRLSQVLSRKRGSDRASR